MTKVALLALGDKVFVAVEHLSRHASLGAFFNADNVPDVQPDASSRGRTPAALTTQLCPLNDSATLTGLYGAPQRRRSFRLAQFGFAHVLYVPMTMRTPGFAMRAIVSNDGIGPTFRARYLQTNHHHSF